MKFVNKYLRNFTPYKLASHKIWLVAPKERNNILKLDWNEATIPPSQKVNERILRLVTENVCYNLYPSTYNNELLKLLSEYIHLPTENIQYFASSDSLHEYIAKLYIAVGDPVLVLGPTYDNFRLTAEVCGADLHFYNIDDDFHFDYAAFEKTIDELDPSLVYICNPNNPTGTIHSIEYIENLLKKYKHTLFLVDEAYAEFSGLSCSNFVLKYENILISRTMSKAFALANFRFGYLLASKNNIDYISKIRNPKNITTFAQEAAIGALSDIPYMINYVKEVKDAKNWFVNSLLKFSSFLKPMLGEGNFIVIRCNDEILKPRLIEVLEENNIFVRNISQTEFLKKFCIRITIGLKYQMEKVIDVIASYLEQTYGK